MVVKYQLYYHYSLIVYKEKLKSYHFLKLLNTICAISSDENGRCSDQKDKEDGISGEVHEEGIASLHPRPEFGRGTHGIEGWRLPRCGHNMADLRGIRSGRQRQCVQRRERRNDLRTNFGPAPDVNQERTRPR